MKTEINAAGVVRVATDDNKSAWTCATPDQADKHLATWTDQQRNDNAPSEIIGAGDVSAVADCANDYRKQFRETGIYKPSARWVYKANGDVVQTIGGVQVSATQEQATGLLANLYAAILPYIA